MMYIRHDNDKQTKITIQEQYGKEALLISAFVHLHIKQQKQSQRQ